MQADGTAPGGVERGWGWFLFSAEGRIKRRSVWLYFVLPFCLFNIAFGTLAAMTGGEEGPLASIYVVVVLAEWIPALFVATKRWHDRGKSGWWNLIVLVPFIGGIWLFIETAVLAGTPGPNRFGDPPAY